MNPLIEVREGFAISWDAIRGNKMRSVLTTLGIVIGIVTVSLMAAAIQGLDGAFLKSVSALGADVFYLQQYTWINNSEEQWATEHKRRPLRIEDAERLADQLTLSASVTPTAGQNATVKYKGISASRVQIIGTTESYLITSGATVAEGRFLAAPDVQGGRPVCVLGSKVATNLFQGESPLGARIRIQDQPFQVVGVLDEQGSLLGMFSLDNRVLIPYRAYEASIENNPDVEIEIKAKALVQLPEAREEIRQVMRRVRRLAPGSPDDFSINQQDQFVSMFHRMTGTIALIGMFVTGLSLFVGGIGIMNIMFVSVAERTREIGVRKAIGAKRRTILLQFLTEAACICLFGGLIGLSIAWGFSLLIRHFLPTTISMSIVVLAIGVSLATGLISGFLPAWRAARMNPVDALRSE